MRDAQAELAVALAEAECGRWQNIASRRSPVADRTRHRSPIADRKGVVSTQLNTLNTRILISAQHGTTSASIIQSLLPALSVLCLRIKVEAASCHFVQKRLEAASTKPATQAVTETETTVENALYRITFTNRGGQVKSWILKGYDDDQGKPLPPVVKTIGKKKPG